MTKTSTVFPYFTFAKKLKIGFLEVTYSYIYDMSFNKIYVTPVEVVETQILYKTKSGCYNLGNYKSQICKDTLDVLECSYNNMYLV